MMFGSNSPAPVPSPPWWTVPTGRAGEHLGAWTLQFVMSQVAFIMGDACPDWCEGPFNQPQFKHPTQRPQGLDLFIPKDGQEKSRTRKYGLPVQLGFRVSNSLARPGQCVLTTDWFHSLFQELCVL